jgi:PAS domain S-box-containing protein
VSASLESGLLQSFIEALPDACVVVDRAGNVLAVNTAWNDLTRRNTATANATGSQLGTSHLSLCRSTSTEKGLDEVRAGLEAVLSGKSKQFEREYLVRSPGVFHWYRKIIRPFRQFGAQAIVFHREITEEKLNKAHPESLDEEFRLLADSAPVLIWMSGPDRACTFFNRQWLEFTGVPLEEQLGEGWLKLVHADDREGISRTYRAASNHKREFEYEYRLKYRDGSYRWIRDHGLPRFDLHHQITGFIGSAWDF